MHTEKLGDLVMNIYKNLKTKIERDLKHYDIGMGQMQILMTFFNDIENTLTQNDLVKLVGVDKGNISRSVLKLLEKGYIEQSDINKKGYRLTAKGVNLKSEIVPIFINLNALITKDIDPSDINQTLITLTKISENLEEII
ncbi:MarR family winged helix-turn-helix transcriptional regulator [Clostridium sulfidigenes]|uniref:MarR family winged helix-turn-helix transcriptional regulator n=1 Tax=Clostridium sulfidigenes TaxID=318464 RepID=UPI003F88D6E1